MLIAKLRKQIRLGQHLRVSLDHSFFTSANKPSLLCLEKCPQGEKKRGVLVLKLSLCV